jgi:malate synthase
MTAAEGVAAEMNAWAEPFLGRRIIDDWKAQLAFTTVIFRARGLHLDDRHIRRADGGGFSASIVDATTFLVNNHARLRTEGRSLVLYLPKIQTAEEAALWSDILSALEVHLGLPIGTVKTYVLVEQFEACFQLMEIRAALGRHFVGFNTGRWDYINSVADALAWDPAFLNPNIDAVTMTYGYMRAYEDRVRQQHETRGCRRRTRTAGRCQRQVGGPLENGSHRPAGLADGRAG